MTASISNNKSVSDGFVYFFIWLVGGLTAFLLSYVGISFLNSQGENVFFGPDSFYHARRILTTAENFNNFYQYDEMSASWISWPWAYDWLLAVLVKVVYFIKPTANGASILTHIPPLLVFLNAFLIVGIGKEISLRPIYIFLLVVCFAISPLTKLLHVPGRIDHHMIEYSFVLGSLWAGISWFKNQSVLSALGLGVVLGLATAFHNGLFILQLPLVLSCIVLWLSRIDLPKNTVILCVGLVVANLLGSLPSQKFLSFEFTFYFQSWFHTYIAVITAISLLCLNRLKFSALNFLYLSIIAVVLLAPIARQFLFGLDFLSAELPNLAAIDEVHSPLSSISTYISEYSYLLLIFPLPLALLIFLEFRHKNPQIIYLLVFMVFGSILLLLQRRLQYFGSLALYLPAIIVFDRYIKALPNKYLFNVGTAFIAMILMYIPSLNALTANRPLGSSFDYAVQVPALEVLRHVCEDKPGKVLADYSDGHFITYHTKCSVIANNMMITPEDFEHIKLTERYLSMTAAEFSALNTDIDYLYIRRADNIFTSNKIEDARLVNAGLRSDLLIDDVKLPSHWQLVAELIDEELPFKNIVKIYNINSNQTDSLN